MHGPSCKVAESRCSVDSLRSVRSGICPSSTGSYQVSQRLLSLREFRFTHFWISKQQMCHLMGDPFFPNTPTTLTPLVWPSWWFRIYSYLPSAAERSRCKIHISVSEVWTVSILEMLWLRKGWEGSCYDLKSVFISRLTFLSTFSWRTPTSDKVVLVLVFDTSVIPQISKAVIWYHCIYRWFPNLMHVGNQSLDLTWIRN